MEYELLNVSIVSSLKGELVIYLCKVFLIFALFYCK